MNKTLFYITQRATKNNNKIYSILFFPVIKKNVSITIKKNHVVSKQIFV